MGLLSFIIPDSEMVSSVRISNEICDMHILYEEMTHFLVSFSPVIECHASSCC